MTIDTLPSRTALVCGAGGFVGTHLVRLLVGRGYWVRGADLKLPEYGPSDAQDFVIADLRHADVAPTLMQAPGGGPVDEVYQLAADMGGVGYLQAAECDILRNSCLINLHVLDAAAEAGVPRYLFSSSACIYRDMNPDEQALTEDDAYPASPHNEYGWEKLYAERTAMAYGRRHGMAIRIARLQNCYGPEGAWHGGREKSPAAICRKVAEIPEGGSIEVWGDGSALRAYTYVDDMVHGLAMLMASELEGGVNIGRQETVSIRELVRVVGEAAGKSFGVTYVPGPIGVRARHFTAERIESIGWQSQVSLLEGLRRTYAWIDRQLQVA